MLTRSGCWRWGLTAALLGSLTSGAGAQENIPASASESVAATQPVDADVAALVAQLGGDDPDASRAAEGKLIASGSGIIPQLQTVLQGQISDDTAARLRSIVHKLTGSAALGGSIITLNYTKAPMMTVLEDFVRQAQADDMGIHRPEIVAAAKDQLVTINVQHANFWAALSALCDATGLSPASEVQGGRMVLSTQPDAAFHSFFGSSRDLTNPQAMVVGPFFIEPMKCDQERHLTYGTTGGMTSNLSLTLAVACEPKLRVLEQNRSQWMLGCVDDRGNSLIAAGLSWMPEPQLAMWYWPLQAGLADTPGRGGKIAELNGEMRITIRSGFKSIDLPDLEKVHEFTQIIDGNAYIVHGFTPATANEGFKLQFSTPMSPAAMRSNRQLMQGLRGDRDLRVTDALGRVLQFATAEQTPDTNSTRAEMTVVYIATPDLAANPSVPNAPLHGPYSLHWEIATETRMLPVRFTFHNLPLP